MAKEADVREFCDEWGIDYSNELVGGLVPGVDAMPSSGRKIYVMQRGKGKVGANLGKTTGWIKRTQLKKRGVETMRGVKYEKVDQDGHLHIAVNGKKRVLEVDHIVVCAGQQSERSLWNGAGKKEGTGDGAKAPQYFLVGGAEQAAEVDAKRAFDQGVRLAATLETAKTGDVFNQPVGFWPTVYMKAQSMGLL
jgi:2,4-dienoyl-CoA reductase (NADPH2)